MFDSIKSTDILFKLKCEEVETLFFHNIISDTVYHYKYLAAVRQVPDREYSEFLISSKNPDVPDNQFHFNIYNKEHSKSYLGEYGDFQIFFNEVISYLKKTFSLTLSLETSKVDDSDISIFHNSISNNDIIFTDDD